MSSLSFYVPEDYDEVEPREPAKQVFRCSDGLCGAQDCARCNPLSHNDEPETSL